MDTEGLLRSLNAHKVRYVVIGAAAFPIHGYARATLDIDTFIESTEENALQTRAPRGEFGYDVTHVSVEELPTKRVLVRQYPSCMLAGPGGGEFVFWGGAVG